MYIWFQGTKKERKNVHIVETCDHTKILVHNIVKTPLLKAFKKLGCQLCKHTIKYLINTKNTKKV